MKNTRKNPRNSIRIFSSFDEENRAEHRRLAAMTPSRRLREFGILQERVWGRRWTKDRIKRIVSIERLTW